MVGITPSTRFLPAVLQLATLLVILPVIVSANPVSFEDSALDLRDIQLPSNWTSLGCVTDDVEIPTLTSWTDVNADMTVETCVGVCRDFKEIYAGVQNGNTCHCGAVLSIIARNASEDECNVPCAGNSAQMCGAPLRLNLYWSGETPPPPPTMVEMSPAGPWNVLGCFNDSNSQRVLSNDVTNNITNGLYNTSVESCTTQCFAEGFTIAGLEFANQCRCGHTLDYPSQKMPAKDCMLPCSGNQSEICGGPDRLTVYFYTGLL